MTHPPRSTSAAPAPRLADLLTRPVAFFEDLGRLPPSPTRYLGVVALASLVSGVSTTLLARHALAAQSSLLSGAGGAAAVSPLFSYGAAAFASIFITVVLWLLLWGLGTLGAGKVGRAAEVYGATFLPLLIWSIILLPVAAYFAPKVNLAAPQLGGLRGLELQKALQQYAQQVQAATSGSLVSQVSTYLGYAVYLWQFALAFIGFRVLTGRTATAWRGVLYPLALLLVLLLASYLVSRAAAELLGG
ncbi:hypothetical protein DKM44_11055 [Deinococcus irradiatisoli]|uniref:Yip1 domain-containing protein n=1 Tax=Deinococcus irradiatisoli TaxID=2202254 RepID=A0A2Z3JK66_9DEIO|nr:YIP1 family protein [Deinococcus irradiatisoli]AWN23700.1 hypothetical protein DKM44_11055 [Deinococcus irradiatisoli]